MKFHVCSFGCRVNQYEGQTLIESLISSGNDYTELESAELVIIRSCVITENSEKKIARMARSISRKGKVAVISGCISVGLKERLRSERVVFLDHDLTRAEYNLKDRISSFAGHTRAFLKIQDGCDSFCSYCIVPYMRSRLTSKPVSKVLDEARKLVSSGYKEIVLTGIHLGKYECCHLSDLITELAKIDGLDRIRLGSLHPQEVSNKLVSLIGQGNLMPHLHISLQSGSNRILDAMNRDYRKADIEKMIIKTQAIPELELTADIIVGFPGETDEDFNCTMEACREAKFSYIHAFPFSFRPGTKACELKSLSVPSEVIRHRMVCISSLRDRLFMEQRQKLVGKEVEVLVEEEKNKKLIGLSRQYFRVSFSGKGLQNKLVKVRITDVNSILHGEIDD